MGTFRGLTSYVSQCQQREHTTFSLSRTPALRSVGSLHSSLPQQSLHHEARDIHNSAYCAVSEACGGIIITRYVSITRPGAGVYVLHR